ncbi:hypothetical protein EDEG_03731 [Edhazardia aedis USNM 41457]|uniref:Rab-GAP TBC domain-containing protein n=1 Tax=Edhazardia aedis (strain USNM 41457) TaxID=1003232 RepID=J9DGL9_EDHAE|nr:hypothetical protein EDEG_03731 [Edhazardia aedis USNM 41457]|eukprot:EJW01750.1 hypothetical protein EDEG_03731 [Edhazardia aedis USNM 41457]
MNENEKIKEKYTRKLLILTHRNTDKYGFIITETPKTSSSLTLADKWEKLLNSTKYKNIDKREIEKRFLIESKKAKSLVFKGIPLLMKYKIWKMFFKEKKSIFMNQRNAKIRDLGISKDQNCITTKFSSIDINETNKIQNYEKYRAQVCSYEHQIHVDVQRTFRKHVLFFDEYGLGQCRLFNVLVAFANIYPEIGYCQGMSSFTALILMYFPEKEAFIVLIDLFKYNNLFSLFDKNLSGVRIILKIQSALIQTLLPSVYKHLIKNEIEMSVFVFSWYLTLFTRFNIDLVLRIWDLFIFYDFTVLLLVGVALLRYCKDNLLSLDGESLLHFITSLESMIFDPDKIVKYVKEFMSSIDIEKYKEELNIGYN